MDIPIDVAGLDQIIPRVGEGSLVVLESAADPAKSYFLRLLCRSALTRDIPTMFITSRDQQELEARFSSEGEDGYHENALLRVTERESINHLEDIGVQRGLVAIDSFSFLTMDMPAAKLSNLLRTLRIQCHEKRTTVLLGTDRGMFDPRSESVAVHMADGVIQFHAKEGPEGMLRLLRIPKWMDGRFVDRNIYYDFDGKRFAIDLRRRVL